MHHDDAVGAAFFGDLEIGYLRRRLGYAAPASGERGAVADLLIADLDRRGILGDGGRAAVGEGPGISLGGRRCLALGLRLELPMLTADRAWG